MIRLPKVPGADPAIYQQYLDAQGLRSTLNQTTGTYFDALSKTQPVADAAHASDMSQLDALFNPSGYQAGLSDIRARRASALSNLSTILQGDMRRNLSMGRIGGGGAGLSSYLASMAGSEAGKVRANEAYDAAGQQRTDLAALLSARQGAVGQRTSNLDAFLARFLTPGTTAASANSTASSALQQAVQQALLNSMIGVGAQA